MSIPPSLPRRQILTRLALSAALLSQGACVYSKYKAAPPNVGTPPLLNYSAGAPPITAAVATMIAFRGPGSWKQDAYWDEYVLRLHNAGAQPATLVSATLTDFLDEPTTPGSDPWRLDRESINRKDALNRRFKSIFVHAGAGYIVTGLGVSIAYGAFAGALAGVVLLPAYAVGNVIRNKSSKRKIEAEFKRRRLVLPLTLASDALVEGSLFFRISPGPKHLALEFRAADASVSNLVIPLPGLANLHLTSPNPTAPTPLAPAIGTTEKVPAANGESAAKPTT